MTQEATIQGIVTEWYESDANSRALMFKLNPDQPDGLFVKIGSWDTKHEHSEFNRLIHIGDKITIEISSRALRAGEPSGLPDGEVT